LQLHCDIEVFIELCLKLEFLTQAGIHLVQ